MSKRVYNPNTCPYCSQIIDNSERQIHLDKCKKFKKSRTIKSKRYLQFVQYFLGKEKGLEFFKNRNNKSRSDLKYLNFLYGKEEGQIRYDRNKYMLSIKGRIEYYIEKFGPIEGPIKYKEKNSKLSVGVDVLRKAGKTEEEIVEIKKTHGKKSGINYENMLRVHKDPQVALDKLITFRERLISFSDVVTITFNASFRNFQ